MDSPVYAWQECRKWTKITMARFDSQAAAWLVAAIALVPAVPAAIALAKPPAFLPSIRDAPTSALKSPAGTLLKAEPMYLPGS
jgi:hypothetical protein